MALGGCEKTPDANAELRKEIGSLKAAVNEHEAAISKMQSLALNKGIHGDGSIDLRLELDNIQQRLESLKEDQRLGHQINADRIEELDHRLQAIEHPLR